MDHPRVSGEHSDCASMPMLSQGSSPRERGAQSGLICHEKFLGIIPA